MENQFIIAIGREFGSGGHEIGRQLAEKLGVNFYDRKLLDHMGEAYDMDMEAYKKYEESTRKLFLSRSVRGHSNSIEENLAEMQFKFIREKAESGESFVIVGRCAESVLRGNPNLISVFILGDEACKVERIMNKYELSEDRAKAKMKDHDVKRKKYHNAYSQFKWGDSRGYDICLNSSRLGIEGSVEALSRYVEDRRAAMK